MRTYLIGAAVAAVAVTVVLGACSDGSGNLPGTTAGAANTSAGSTSMPAGGSGDVAGSANPGTGGSSVAGTTNQPTAGSPSGTAGDVGAGGSSSSGGGAAGMASTSGGMGGAPGGGAPASGGTGGMPMTGPFKILILSTALEYPHDSIPDCQYMLGLESAKTKAQQHWAQATPISGAMWTADLATDDLAQFTDATLKNYAMVFSCSPTGTVFSNNPKVANKTVAMTAFQHFVEGGGAWGGIHSATDFEKTNGFPWFTNTLTGAYFVDHNNDGTSGTVQTDPNNSTFPILNGVAATYATQDEWYKMNRDVSAQPGFKILQRLAADNRPLTWAKEIANPAGGTGGRMFYTVRGHNPTVYKEAEFRKLVLQGILWATRRSN